MAKFYDRVKMAVASTGTGTLTLSTALPGYRSVATAGGSTGDVFSYVIEDGSNWEAGTGTYNATSNTLTRSVIASSAGGTTAISVTLNATIFITILASDFNAKAGNGVNSDITSLTGLSTPLSWAQGGTGNTGGAWTQTSVTPTPAGGSFTATAFTRSEKIGKKVWIYVEVNISNNNTAGGWIQVPLPYTPATNFTCIGREMAVVGKPLIGFYNSGVNALIIENLTDGSYPGGTNYLLALNGEYEAV